MVCRTSMQRELVVWRHVHMQPILFCATNNPPCNSFHIIIGLTVVSPICNRNTTQDQCSFHFSYSPIRIKNFAEQCSEKF